MACAAISQSGEGYVVKQKSAILTTVDQVRCDHIEHTNDINVGIANGMPNGINVGIANGMPNGINVGIANGMPNDINVGIANGTANGMRIRLTTPNAAMSSKRCAPIVPRPPGHPDCGYTRPRRPIVKPSYFSLRVQTGRLFCRQILSVSGHS